MLDISKPLTTRDGKIPVGLNIIKISDGLSYIEGCINNIYMLWFLDGMFTRSRLSPEDLVYVASETGSDPSSEPEKEECLNCKYLLTDPQSWLFCRRFPPAGVENDFPRISDGRGWCGEWKARE